MYIVLHFFLTFSFVKASLHITHNTVNVEIVYIFA